jgi:hypothetical protein
MFFLCSYVIVFCALHSNTDIVMQALTLLSLLSPAQKSTFTGTESVGGFRAIKVLFYQTMNHFLIRVIRTC